MPVSEGTEESGPHISTPRELRRQAYLKSQPLCVRSLVMVEKQAPGMNVSVFLLAPVPWTAGCFRKTKRNVFIVFIMER